MEQEEYKHVCRLCNKKYPSGKSLGGHMRSHVISKTYVPLHKLNSKKALNLCKSNGNHLSRNTIKGGKVKKVLVAGESSSEASGGRCGGGESSSTYAVKKWGVDSTVTIKQEYKELSMESHSDNEVGYDDYEKRSAEEPRYRAIALIDSFTLEKGCSSSKSEIELEQEQVALCLMMLSRDSSHRIGTLPESSANNSDVVQVRSSSTYVAKRKYLNYETNSKNNGFLDMKNVASQKLNCLEMDSSDSGFFENGAKEVESDDSADGYARNYGIKNPKSKSGSGCDVHDSELGKRTKKSGKHYSEKTLIAPVEEGDELGNQAQVKKYMKKTNDHLSSEQALSKSSQKAGKYKCSICQRSFKTHQALGGHIITHKRDFKGAISEFRSCKNGENSSEASNFGSKSESYGGKVSSTKGHCCPFCHKVFRSGQALGGHKRSHLTKCSSQDEANSVQESPPENQHLLIDLNLPASPVEENGNFVP